MMSVSKKSICESQELGMGEEAAKGRAKPRLVLVLWHRPSAKVGNGLPIGCWGLK